MTAKKKRKPDDRQQSQRFVETAKKLEVDENGKAFERVLKSVQLKKNRAKEKS